MSDIITRISAHASSATMALPKSPSLTHTHLMIVEVALNKVARRNKIYMRNTPPPLLNALECNVVLVRGCWGEPRTHTVRDIW